MRPRPWLVVLLALVALLVATRVTGWTLSARDPLPVTEYAATRADDPRTFQTLASERFEAGGASFAWEVLGFPEMVGGGVHAFEYRVHRVGGDEARIWPGAALLLDPHGDNLGEGSLERPASVENGVLVVRQGFQPRGPGGHDLTAVLRLDVARPALVGYFAGAPHELRLPVHVQAVPPEPQGGE